MGLGGWPGAETGRVCEKKKGTSLNEDGKGNGKTEIGDVVKKPVLGGGRYKRVDQGATEQTLKKKSDREKGKLGRRTPRSKRKT